MDLSSNVFKVIGGVGAASVTAVATGVGIDQNNKNVQRQKELDEKRALEEKENQRVLEEQRVFQAAVESIKESSVGKTNWFDGGLIEFLEDQDIVFGIFKGNDTTKLTVINSVSQVMTVIIKVLISENSEQLKKSDSGKVKIEHLKALRNGEDWTWSCNIKFSGLNVDTTISKHELNDKDKFFNDQKNGFFDVLTKDLTEETDTGKASKEKEIKKRFIKNCSTVSTDGKSPDTLITVRPDFYLGKNVSSGDEKLYFISGFGNYDAKKWFNEDINLLSVSETISDSREKSASE